VPFLFIQLAAAEKLDRRARSDCDICDNEAGMVSRQMIMDGVWQDPESSVEEVDENEKDKDEKAKLTAGSHLASHQRTGSEHSQVRGSYDAPRHVDSPEPRGIQGGPVEDTSAS
jgi:hypothetical protein